MLGQIRQNKVKSEYNLKHIAAEYQIHL